MITEPSQDGTWDMGVPVIDDCRKIVAILESRVTVRDIRNVYAGRMSGGMRCIVGNAAVKLGIRPPYEVLGADGRPTLPRCWSKSKKKKCGCILCAGARMRS